MHKQLYGIISLALATSSDDNLHGQIYCVMKLENKIGVVDVDILFYKLGET
jgi:hypothetical protein